MKGTATGRDVIYKLEKCVDRSQLQLFRLDSIAMNSATATCSEKMGLVGLLKNKLKESYAVS